MPICSLNTFVIATGTPTIGGANNIEIGGSLIQSNGASTTTTLNVTNTGTTTISGPVYMTDHPTAVDNQTLAVNVDYSAGATTIGGAIQDRTPTSFAGSVGSFVKSGLGTLTLSGANTYTGATNIQDGTLQLTGSLSSATALNLGTASSSGKLILGGAAGAVNQTVARLTTTGLGVNTVVGGNASVSTLTVNSSTNDTFAGMLGGSAANEDNLAFTKAGIGTLTLSGYNTYSGATAINGGKLIVTGNLINSDLTLTSGALDGANSLIKSVTVASNAANTVANGNGGTGSLTITNGLSFNGSAALALTTSDAAKYNPAVAVYGALTTTGAGSLSLTVNSTDSGWASGTYNLITYGSLGGSGFSAFPSSAAVVVTPGLTARQTKTLTNNATYNQIQLIISGDNPVWSGAVNGNWDYSTNNWWLPTQAQATAFLANDKVTFDNTGANTTISISAADVNPDRVDFNSGAYVINGPYGITGGGSVYINAGATATLASPNSYGGGTTVTDGTLNINSNTALGTGALTIAGSGLSTLDNTSGSAVALTTANPQNWNGDFAFTGTNDLNLGTGAVTMSASRIVTTNGTATLTVGSPIGGTGGLTKAGTGTLALAGANTYNGRTTISQGVLDVTGSITTATNLAGATVIVGNTVSQNAVMKISGGSVTANTSDGQFTSSLLVGSVAGAAGSIKLSSGSLTTNQQFGLGAGTGAYSALTQTGGTITSGSWFVVGFNSDVAVLNQSTGSITLNSNRMTIGAGGGASNGLYNLSGTGSFTATSGSGGIYVGENGTGTLNVSGSATLNIATNGVRIAPNNGSTGTVNLLGGTITTNAVSQGTGTGTFNFNGGTLKANSANASFLTGLTNAYVYSGGAVIDDGGNAVTIGQSLLAPPSSGVSASGLTVSGGGFIDTPIVQISGDGTGAAAVATIDSAGNLTGITMTNPGVNYTYAPTFTLLGGGIGNTGEIGGTASLVTNVGGGLTKQGAGALTLTGTSTYTGATSVNAGTLILSGAGDINGSSGITINGAGAKFVQVSATPSTPAITLTQGTLDGTGTVGAVTIGAGTGGIVTNGVGVSGTLTTGNLTFNGAGALALRPLGGANTATAPLAVSGTLTTPGVAGTITVDAVTVSPFVNGSTYNLISYSSSFSGNLSDFILGNTFTPREKLSSFVLNGNNIALAYAGDSVKWTGGDNGNWVIGAAGREQELEAGHRAHHDRLHEPGSRCV